MWAAATPCAGVALILWAAAAVDGYSLFFDEPKDNATLTDASFCVTYNYTSNEASSSADGFAGTAVVVLQSGWTGLSRNDTQVVCTADPPLPYTSDCCQVEDLVDGNWSLWLFQIDPAETTSVIYWDALNFTVKANEDPPIESTSSIEPTDEPTAEPTEEPTPTVEPTGEPTDESTVTTVTFTTSDTPEATATTTRHRHHHHGHRHRHRPSNNVTWDSFGDWFDACIANTFM